METHKPKIIREENSVLLLPWTTRNLGNVANVRNTQNRSPPVKNNFPYSKHYDEDVLLGLLYFGKQRTTPSISGLHRNHYRRH